VGRTGRDAGVAIGTRGSSQRRSTRPRFDSASLAITGIPADVLLN
jgi:hypothetical protein